MSPLFEHYIDAALIGIATGLVVIVVYDLIKYIINRQKW